MDFENNKPLAERKPNGEKICILPRLSGLGGPVSFQGRLITGLARRGIEVVHDPLAEGVSAMLVIGGTSRLREVWQARRRGVRLVQRLNGMNWMHRRRYWGVKYFLRAEWNNRLLAFIRQYWAHHIVYQSQFARNWWQTVYRTAPAKNSVIYNSVDLRQFTPDGPGRPPQDRKRILLVEARLGGGYEQGLENAIQLVKELRSQDNYPVELVVAGDVAPEVRRQWENQSEIPLVWSGIVPAMDIPALDRSAHVLFSSDLNAACPNSVVEALACGLPVVGFATGSLPELISEEAGRVAPYGSNYWNLEAPDITALVEATREVLASSERFRSGARRQAENLFDVEQMVTKYIDVLLG